VAGPAWPDSCTTTTPGQYTSIAFGGQRRRRLRADRDRDRPVQDRADQAPRALAHPEQVEAATLDYVDWFNRHRLFETWGDIPPAELEAAYYRQNASLAEAG
jgi:transposase InsO family protein